jgi:hypothetical protein
VEDVDDDARDAHAQYNNLAEYLAVGRIIKK